jgi:hypothetical protein
MKMSRACERALIFAARFRRNTTGVAADWPQGGVDTIAAKCFRPMRSTKLFSGYARRQSQVIFKVPLSKVVKWRQLPSSHRTSEAAALYRASVVAFALLMMSAIPAGSGYVLDIGDSSCGKWIEARRVHGTLIEGMHTSWIYGYLSAAAALLAGEARSAVFFGKNNKTLIEKADILSPKYIDADAINAWMDNYCGAHPLERIADALRVLLAGLKVKTGYLEEAVCETSDLEQVGRAGCRKAFEAIKGSILPTLEGGSQASLIPNNRKPYRPLAKPAAPAQSAQGPPIIVQSLMQWLNATAEGAPRRDSSASSP